MEIIIRPAQVGDASGIARVRVITWQHAYQGMISKAHLDALDIEQQIVRWNDGLRNLPAENRVFVAEVDPPDDGAGRTVVGFCACGPERTEDEEHKGEIYALYVLPEFHRQGLGKRLVQAAARFLSRQGYQRMIIYVLRDNWPSRAFYEAIGGKAAREKIVEIGGAMLLEVGYGYGIADLLENS